MVVRVKKKASKRSSTSFSYLKKPETTDEEVNKHKTSQLRRIVFAPFFVCRLQFFFFFSFF